MRVVALFGLLVGGCGDPGPSPEEVQAKKVERDCSKLYGSLTKVLKDRLREGGVKPELGDRDGFVALCVESGLDEEQRRCLDPNLGGTDACKEALEPVKDKTKELTDYLLAPMKEGKPGAAGE